MKALAILLVSLFIVHGDSHAHIEPTKSIVKPDSLFCSQVCDTFPDGTSHCTVVCQ